MQTAVARKSWLITYWILFAVFVATAALNVLHVRGGLWTNYAADAVVPAWLYIVTRGLWTPSPTFAWARKVHSMVPSWHA